MFYTEIHTLLPNCVWSECSITTTETLRHHPEVHRKWLQVSLPSGTSCSKSSHMGRSLSSLSSPTLHLAGSLHPHRGGHHLPWPHWNNEKTTIATASQGCGMSYVTQEERDELAQTVPGSPAGCGSAFGLCQGPGIRHSEFPALTTAISLFRSKQKFSVKELELSPHSVPNMSL